MGKKSGSNPAPPNPAATAAAQSAANKEAVKESAKVNQINEVNPWGSLSYTGTIGEPDRTRTVSLNDAGQEIFDKQQGITNTLADFATNRAGSLPTEPFSFDGLGDLPSIDKDYRSEIRDAMFARLQPDRDRARESFETRMANQGIVDPNSDAYKDAVDELNRKDNDLRLAIDAASGSEMTNMFNLGLTGRQQAISEYMTERNAPINELSVALQGSPALGSPNFAPQAQYSVAAPDISGMTMGNYAGQMNAANNASSNANALAGNAINAGGSLGGAYLMASALSDRRLKKDIHKVGRLSGLNVYSFRYIWGGPIHIGVMAQEALKTIPEAVFKIGEWLAVDYSKVWRAA